MLSRTCLEMPVVGGESPDNPPRPKYPVLGNATLVYRRPYVYIVFRNEADVLETAKHPDTRRLTPIEVRELEDSLSFPSLLGTAQQKHSGPGPVGLGDIVSWLTGKLGIEACDACRKRKSWLNRFVIWPRHR